MKKLFLSLIAVAVGTLSSFAQDDLVATLSHGSTLTTFTGADAFSDAYTAAAEGDVVTLSPGVFNAVNIEKAITIRGAGMIGMESNGFVSTQLAGDMIINVPSDASYDLSIEGVQVLSAVYLFGNDLAPVKLTKSRFERAVIGWGVGLNAHSCIFASELAATREQNLTGSTEYKNTTINCMNCVIVNASSQGLAPFNPAVAKIVATNCLVNLSFKDVHYSVFNNCIITSQVAYPSTSFPLPDTSTAQKCIGINTNGSTPDLFVNQSGSSNNMIEGSGTAAFNALFKTLSLLGENPAFSETYELTTTAAATYLSDDGTQVGIYGGTNPFNPTPTNPQVKTFTVSSTTEGEQLRVTINVE